MDVDEVADCLLCCIGTAGRSDYQTRRHALMNSQVNMGKPSEIGGESASASTMTALQALKLVTSSAPRRLTASEIVLLRQSKRDEARERGDGQLKKLARRVLKAGALWAPEEQVGARVRELSGAR